MLSSSDNKVIFVGLSGVGKTSLVQRRISNTFNQFQEATIGAAYTTINEEIDNDTKISFGVWDTAGQERYDALTPLYFRGSRVVVVVFDLSKCDSFEKARYWLENIKVKYGEYIEGYILVGTKCDLHDSRKVTVEEAHNLAEEYGTHYYETSAYTGECINDLFKQIALIIYNAPPVFETVDINDAIKLTGSPKPGRENCYSYITPSCSC